MRIQLEQSRCQGHGNCYNYHPDLFAPDKEAFAAVKVPGALNPQQVKAAQSAAADCPEGAISVVASEPAGSNT